MLLATLPTHLLNPTNPDEQQIPSHPPTSAVLTLMLSMYLEYKILNTLILPDNNFCQAGTS